jgi:hypothetical protein
MSLTQPVPREPLPSLDLCKFGGGSVLRQHVGHIRNRRQHFTTLQPANCSTILCYNETMTLVNQSKKAAESPTSLATAEGCTHKRGTS